MSEFLNRISLLSPKRLALLALEQHDQIEAAKQKATEPIAVIGMACRFPGGDGVEAFWRMLDQGTDAIGEVPSDRWNIDAYFDPDPDTPARMSVRKGGFLADVSGFDAALFGISPREALTMDPQQRMLLETSWSALENAGIPAQKLVGSSTGVFVGICNSDYSQRLLRRGEEEIDAYLASGNALSVAAGRIAYCFGLQGPALAIDTACSSSLVALHVACRSLRSGDCKLALAAGVNLICAPEITIALSKAHMLAPDGRCKTFDAAADGFSRGEGCGVLILKPLSAAQADGDRILALIKGSAVNQDGRSGGLTVPNGPAQESVIRAAMRDAGVQASDIDYVEAHGTGTSLGDPIEVRALARVFGEGRSPENPLLIGSVKTNIGHLESAAGVAGVIKVILGLQHARLPAHLNFNTPSPHIPWSDYSVRVVGDGVDWPRTVRRRLAGVSSFGFSGTNAHVLVEEAPAITSAKQKVDPNREFHCLTISARCETALADLARQYAELLSRDGVLLADVAHTANIGRSHLAQRIAVVAHDAKSAAEALREFGEGRSHEALFRGTVEPGANTEVVFMFAGQGSQYPGMLLQLYETSDVVRETIDRCDEILGPDERGITLKSVLMSRGDNDEQIHETRWSQPALFAVEYALTQLWRSWGIEPAAVIGHSVGEYVAACVAGVFTLEDGLKLIAKRGQLLQALPPGGAMATIFAAAEDVKRAIETKHGLSIAAFNAPEMIVVSGDATALDSLVSEFAARNIKSQRLFVSFAAHSPQVDPALPAMQASADGVKMAAPCIPVAWNVTGGAPLVGGAPDAVYWRRHLREPVRFSESLARLHRDGYRIFLEVGPHPTLASLAQQCLPESEVLTLSSVRRGKTDWQELMTSLARLYVAGAAIDWSGLDKPHERTRLSLPIYPFQRQKYWIDLVAKRALQGSKGATAGLIGRRLPTALPIFEAILTKETQRYLPDHLLFGAMVVPGPVFLELAQQAIREIAGIASRAVEHFTIHRPLVLPDGGCKVQTHIGEEQAGARSFSIYSCADDDANAWHLQATGSLVATANSGSAEQGNIAAIKASLRHEIGSDDYRTQLADRGIKFGPAFWSLNELHLGDGEALVKVVLPTACANDRTAWAHPVLLDGAFQSIGVAIPSSTKQGSAYLLTEVERIDLRGELPTSLWCRARVRNPADRDPVEWRADATLYGMDGTVLGMLQGVVLRRVSSQTLGRVIAESVGDKLFYEMEWRKVSSSRPAAPLLSDPTTFMAEIERKFSMLADQHGLSIYDGLSRDLDRLSSGHVVDALRKLGFDGAIGRSFSADDEAQQLGVVTQHRRLFRRLLEILVEENVLSHQGGGYRVISKLPEAQAQNRYRLLLDRYGEVDGELGALQRCGPSLAAVLSGVQNPLHLLFPNGSLAEAQKLYVDSPYARTYNHALVAAVQAAIAQLPQGTKLRVLEIGAGTGGSTSYLLPALSADQIEYDFTDLSPTFLKNAEERFGRHHSFRTAMLDIERDPLEQGFSSNGYDIIIAANVLHATADLRHTLGNVRRLMAPGAILFLLEGLAPERWVDLTFGLTDGWWRFKDADLRPDYPLLSRSAWASLLQDVGFTSVTSILGEGVAAAAQQGLFLSRAPCDGQKWTLVISPANEDPSLKSTASRDVAEHLSERLCGRGDIVKVVAADADDVDLAAGENIIYLAALDLTGVGLDTPGGSYKCRTVSGVLPHRWLASTTKCQGRVWLITQGTQAAGGTLAVGAAWQAPVWGWGRGFALEHPARWGALIDMPADASPDTATDLLIRGLDSTDDEDQIAWRGGERLVARVVKCPSPPAAPPTLRSDACYLVTGGFGGLGLLLARWMAENGAKHIALLGRHPVSESSELLAIKALGTQVYALRADVGDEAEMAIAFQQLRFQAPPLKGVVHAAVAMTAAPLTELDDAQIQGMMRSKVDGAVVLERLTRAMSLDFLLMFSSTTAIFGASGLSHYAAANSFMDVLAHATNGPRQVISINWGTWELMRLASVESQRSFKEGGMQPMSSSEALDALGRTLGSSRPQAMIAKVDWTQFKALYEARRVRPLLTELGEQARPTSAIDLQSNLELMQRLKAAPVAMRREILTDFVQAEAAATLGLSVGANVTLSTGLFDLGMDSLMALELKRRLERGTGLSLPSTLTFNYPSVEALAGYLEELVAPPADTQAKYPPPPIAAEVPAEIQSGEIDSLSDSELEERLLARLRQIH